MKALRQLGFLKLSLPPGDAPPEEDDRVLALFRNRAELKKAYGELEEEIYRLKDRVKQQEGATQRVQEMLSALEARLGVTEAAYPALVFYQLRRLWQAGRELIEQFVADLARQQDERERRAHLAEHNRRQFARARTLEQQLDRGASARAEAARTISPSCEAERARLTRFWHYFKRRALRHASRARGRRSRRAARVELAAARGRGGRARAEPVPEFPGLSLEARRAINLAAIAYAEVLCLRLAELRRRSCSWRARRPRSARSTRRTTARRASACCSWRQIERAHALLSRATNIAQEVQSALASGCKQVARYRNATDTAPTADSIAFSEGRCAAERRGRARPPRGSAERARRGYLGPVPGPAALSRSGALSRARAVFCCGRFSARAP